MNNKTAIQRHRMNTSLGKKRTMSVYVFWVDGLLIDTGPRKAQKQALDLFDSLQIDQVALTHHHEDHCGNLKALLGQRNRPVFGHVDCARILKNPPKLNFMERQVWGGLDAVSSVRPLRDHIQTPNYCFQGINTPGHSDDHLCFYEANEGWLFTGDLYVHHFIRYFIASESVAAQIRSLQTLLALDFDFFYCSHSHLEVLKKDLLYKKLQFFETFYGSVVELNLKGYSEMAIMQQLNMKERWTMRLLSRGNLSGVNLIRAVLRDEQHKECLSA